MALLKASDIFVNMTKLSGTAVTLLGNYAQVNGFIYDSEIKVTLFWNNYSPSEAK